MPEPSDELRAITALSLVPGLGPRLTQALIERFGSAAAACRGTADEFQTVPHVGRKLSQDFAAALQRVDPDAELNRAAERGVRMVAKHESAYPSPLRTIHDPPWLLYCRGDDYRPVDHSAVAIVGSRRCTPYGRKVAEQMAAGLVRAGHTVVSGLALGIDGCAHRGALEAGGRTVAVLAGGLSSIYPPDHVELAESVARSGLLMTETPMMMAPERGMFHARNRLISGLSRAVVIIEANDKSGALITARHAVEQGREVFVVPGNIDSAGSAGSLRLLRDGAKLIRGIDDLLDDLRGIFPAAPPNDANRPMEAPAPQATNRNPAPSAPPAAGPPPGLDERGRAIWDLLTEPRNLDELIRNSGLSAGELNRTLLMLEMSRIVQRLPGNIYARR